jgi:hypothetical protein
VPTKREHLAAARRHLSAYRAAAAAFPDWGAVMLFYSALHVMESLFAGAGVHCPDHARREQHIKNHHKQVWSAYHRLQTESAKARYLQGGAFSMNAGMVRQELWRKKFREIRRYVRAQQGSSLFGTTP